MQTSLTAVLNTLHEVILFTAICFISLHYLSKHSNKLGNKVHRLLLVALGLSLASVLLFVMTKRGNLYEFFGIQRDFSQKELKKAYREKLRSCHPDKKGETEQFLHLRTAFEVLGNVKSATFYDEKGGEIDDLKEVPMDFYTYHPEDEEKPVNYVQKWLEFVKYSACFLVFFAVKRKFSLPFFIFFKHFLTILLCFAIDFLLEKGILSPNIAPINLIYPYLTLYELRSLVKFTILVPLAFCMQKQGEFYKEWLEQTVISPEFTTTEISVEDVIARKTMKEEKERRKVFFGVLMLFIFSILGVFFVMLSMSKDLDKNVPINFGLFTW